MPHQDDDRARRTLRELDSIASERRDESEPDDDRVGATLADLDQRAVERQYEEAPPDTPAPSDVTEAVPEPYRIPTERELDPVTGFARAVGRYPAQLTENVGRVLQAGAASPVLRMRSPRGQKTLESLRELKGGQMDIPEAGELHLPDPVAERITGLGEEIETVGREVREKIPASPSVRRARVFPREPTEEERSARASERLIREAQRERLSERFPEDIASRIVPEPPEDVDTKTAALQPKWWLEGGTEVATQVGSQAALALLSAGGGPLLQFTAWAGPIGVLEGGEAYNESLEQIREGNPDMPEQEARARAAGLGAITAAGNTVLEVAPFAAIVLRRVPGAGKVFRNGILDRLQRAVFRTPGRAVTFQSLTEGMEEVSQEAFADAVRYAAAVDPEAFEDFKERAAQSFLLGGGGAVAVTGPLEIGRSVADRRTTKLMRRLEDVIEEIEEEGAPELEELGIEPAAEPEAETEHQRADATLEELDEVASERAEAPVAPVGEEEPELAPGVTIKPEAAAEEVPEVEPETPEAMSPEEIEAARARVEEEAQARQAVEEALGDRYLEDDAFRLPDGRTYRRGVTRTFGGDIVPLWREVYPETGETIDPIADPAPNRTLGEAPEDAERGFLDRGGNFVPSEEAQARIEEAQEAIRAATEPVERTEGQTEPAREEPPRPVPEEEQAPAPELQVGQEVQTPEGPGRVVELDDARVTDAVSTAVVELGTGRVVEVRQEEVRPITDRDREEAGQLRIVAEEAQAAPEGAPEPVPEGEAAPPPTPPEADVEPEEASDLADVAPEEQRGEITEEPATEEEAEGGVREAGLPGRAREVSEEREAEALQEAEEEREAEEAPERGREGGERPVRPGARVAPSEPTAGEGRSREEGLGEHGADDDRGDGETREGAPSRPGVESGAAERVRGVNYRITDADELGAGGLKEKARTNLEAIRVLKRLEGSGRPATVEEQRTLVKYVGWGGLAQKVFSYSPKFKDIRDELSDLLTEEEFRSAKASTPNAHYTSKTVINAMYDALDRIGFTGGRVLEPSAGVGHFIGLMPQGLARDSRWTAIELESITGRIAKLLYPEEHVYVRGYEATHMPDESFDAAISNVPFGNYRVHDPRYNKLKLSIHNYFFIKTLDKVRPGGLIAFVTSRHTMDAEGNARARKLISEQADLLGAIRLPRSTFEKNANTSVTTDVIFLRKRAVGEEATGESWQDVETRNWEHVRDYQPSKEGTINEYFARHPEMMLGEMRAGAGTHFTQAGLVPDPDVDLRVALQEAVGRLPSNVYSETTEVQAIDEAVIVESEEEDLKAGSLSVVDGEIKRWDGSQFTDFKVPKRRRTKVKKLIGIRDAALEVLRTQREDRPDSDIEAAQEALNEAYDDFVDDYGPINRVTRTKNNAKRTPNHYTFESDPDAPLVFSLEDYDEDHDTATKAEIFTERVIEPRREVEVADSSDDALVASLKERGRVDLDFMRQLTGFDEDKLLRDLKGRVFRDPNTGEWLTDDEYLSGNVRKKLDIARMAAETDDSFEENVEALEEVQPDDLPPSKISPALGSPWIEPETIAEFMAEILDASPGSFDVEYLRKEAFWKIRTSTFIRSSTKSTRQWGTDKADAPRIIEDALNQRLTKVTMYDPLADRRVIDPEATVEAREKQQRIKDKFRDWFWKNPDRADHYARIYNDEYNNTRLREFDGSHLDPPNLNAAIRLYSHQKDAAWRIIASGNTLLWHEVGAGKTFAMVAAGMEMRRMGMVKKPTYVVPNHMREQFAADIRRLFPDAKVLTPTKKDFKKKRRRKFISRIATGDWDAVVVTYEQFKRIPLSPAAQRRFIENELYEYQKLHSEAEAKSEQSTVKQIEKRIKEFEVQLQELINREGKDPGPFFEDTGIDFLMVDEVHNFKKIAAKTKIRNLSFGHSQRAIDLLSKVDHLNEQNPGRSTVFATGTPLTNTIAEVYVMQRYLQPELLAERGVEHFDSWASMFAEQKVGQEINVTATGIRSKARFVRFHNVSELKQMFHQVADQVSIEEIPEVTRPRKEEQVVNVEATAELHNYTQELESRGKKVKTGQVPKTEDNWLNISTDGRLSAIDLRAVDEERFDEDPQSKVFRAADRIAETWEQTEDERLTQLVFVEFSAPKEAWNAVEAIRDLIIERGVPEKEIGLIWDAKDDASKEELFRKVRRGDVRILFGSSKKMGVGTNVQDRVVAVHEIDPPWRPDQVEQSEGRAWRQGNMNPVVHVYRYVTEGSFDAYMWQTLERKAGFIEQFRNRDLSVREVEDIDRVELDYGTVKAIATGDERFMELARLTDRLSYLEAQEARHLDNQIEMRRDHQHLRSRVEALEETIPLIESDVETVEPQTADDFTAVVENSQYGSYKETAEAIHDVSEQMTGAPDGARAIGNFAGLTLWLAKAGNNRALELRGKESYSTQMGIRPSVETMIGTLRNIQEKPEKRLKAVKKALASARKERKALKPLIGKPFDRAEELERIRKEKKRIEKELEIGAADRQVEVDEEDTLSDELRENPEAGFLDLGPIFDMFAKQQAREEGFESLFPNVEERMRAAEKGRAPKSLRERGMEALRNLKKAWRTFPEIDANENAQMALSWEILRQVLSAGEAAKVEALWEIHRVLDGLSDEESRVFTRNLALPDILRSVEEGLYDAPLEDLAEEGKLFGYPEVAMARGTSLKQVIREDLAEAQAEAEARPNVREALRKRAKFTRALTKRLVEDGLLPDKVLEDPRYYHRQVLRYYHATDVQFVGLRGQTVRLRTQGFQKKRVGGGDFNLRYHESEFEWVSQALTQIHRKEALDRLQELLDVMPQLKREARRLNIERLDQKLIESGADIEGADGLLRPYRQQIARANRELAEMAADGELVSSRFERLIADLGASYAQWKSEMSERAVKDRDPFRFQHPDWFAFLSELAEENQPGAKQAASIFKAINEREEKVKDTLGDDYIDPTGRTKKSHQQLSALAPEGYDLWYPEKGNHFFMALTIEERILQQVIANPDSEIVEQLPDHVRSMLVVGGPKPAWVIPEGVAKTLDDMEPTFTDDYVDQHWRALVQTWKQWILLMPIRALRYNFNNMSGDADIAWAYSPRIIKDHFTDAAKDLRRFHYGKDLDEDAEREIRQAVRQGVIQSGLTIAEIPDISDAGLLRRLGFSERKGIRRLVNRYWDETRTFTVWRENILRLAAYRYFKDEIAKGTEPKGATNPIQLKAIQDPRERAARLSRDLIGDYGKITVAGRWLRRHLIPFWSWQEINAPRYVRMFRNIRHEGEQDGKRRRIAATVGKRGLVNFMAKAGTFYAFAWMWNILNPWVPDEEKEAFLRGRKNLRLVLLKAPDGEVRSIRLEGALADALEWVNLSDFPSDIRDLIDGKADFMDKAVEAFPKAQIDRIVNGWEPVSKTLFEMVIGASTYPSVFEEGASLGVRTRPIRDRSEHFVRAWALDGLYRLATRAQLTGPPKPMKRISPLSLLDLMLLYRSDPGQQAYWVARSMGIDFLKREVGQAAPGIIPTERSNALYYYKRALSWDDDEAADAWRDRYFELGGTPEGMAQSIRMSHPLESIPEKYRNAFRRSLSEREMGILSLGIRWHESVYRSRSKSPYRQSITKGQLPRGSR